LANLDAPAVRRDARFACGYRGDAAVPARA